MGDEFRFERVLPDDSRAAADRPCVFVLGDWQHPGVDPLDAVKRIIHSGASGVPIVAVVDDVGGTDEEHRARLASLTKAGAVVLEPEDESERAAMGVDPVAFANRVLAAAQQAARSIPASPEPGVPTQPDGYREFGNAFTRLTDDELRELIEGERPAGWQYES